MEVKESQISRRSFLKGAAAGTAAVAGSGLLAGCGAASKGYIVGEPKKWDYETDVLVVGSGGGLGAALEAKEAGADVIVLEWAPVLGGDAALNGGQIYAGGGTSIQKAAGVDDTVDAMYKYMLATGGDYCDPEKIRVYCERSAETVEKLIEWGVVFPVDKLKINASENMPQFAAITPPVARGHILDPGIGSGFTEPMINTAKAKGVQFHTETRAKELIVTAENEVVGLRAESGGEAVFYRAKRGVVLATGNFRYHKRLMQCFRPKFASGTKPVGTDYHAGDGTVMAMALGSDLAFIAGMDDPLALTYSDETGTIILAAPASQIVPSIYVNEEAIRFADEGLHYGVLGQIAGRQTNSHAYCIFDEDAKKIGEANTSTIPGTEGYYSKPANMKASAPTIKELATGLGLDPDKLEETVATWNANAETGADPDFGRTVNLLPIKTAPFHAIDVMPQVSAGFGGLNANTKGQVVDVNGNPIPRLYASGDLTGGHIGRIYSSGSKWGNAIIWARICGQNAAAETPMS